MSIIVSDRIAQERQDLAMSKFDADTLRALRDVQEPTIRTDEHPKTAVVIWVAVDGDDVFGAFVAGHQGRLVPGPRGGRPRHIGGCRTPVGGAGNPRERRCLG